MVEGIEWPAIANPAGATMLAMLWQLERSQWWSGEEILDQQFRQLREVASHAIARAPYYATHLACVGLASVRDLTAQTFLRWPLLSRVENHAQLAASAYAKEHDGVAELFLQALALRDHLWHGRDLSAKLTIIPAELAGAAAQLQWLAAESPPYVATSPDSLRALLQHSRETGKVPAGVQQVVVSGPPSAELRAALERIWQAQLVSVYSHGELGPVALQCPSHEHYHVQSENFYVEVLRQDGTPCSPGERGRVVVTALHRFPTPLLRLELGDHAQFGEACPCGRGLPVLEDIIAAREW